MREYWRHLKLFNNNVRYFLIAGAVHGFVFFGIYTLLLNLYLLRLGYEPEFLGLVNGLGPLMLAVFSIPAGIASSRWGSRRVMIWSYLVLAVSFGGLPMSEFLPEAIRPAWIVGTFTIAWIGGAFVVVNFAPYLMAWTGEQERNYAFAMQAASLPVAGFLGNLLGGILPSFFANAAGLNLNSPVPYRNALLVAACIELLAVVIMRRTAEMQQIDAGGSGQADAAEPPPFRLFFIFGFISLLSVAGEWTLRVYYNVYLDRVLATPTTIIGAISAIAQLMGLTAFLVPQATALWGRNRVVLIGLFSIFIAFLPIIFVHHWLAVGAGYMILVGFLSLSYPALQVFGQSLVGPRWRTSLASAISMALGLGIALTSLGGGYVVAASGFRTLFIIGAAAGLIGAAVVWRLLPGEPAAVPVPQAGGMD